MFKVEKNPIDEIEKKFLLIGTLLDHNHIKSNQPMIISLGLDKDTNTYNMQLTFNNYTGYNPTVKKTALTLRFPIVKTDGFTSENAQVAKKVFSDYCNENLDFFEENVKYGWKDYGLELQVITKSPVNI